VGNVNPTGTITYKVFSDNKCSQLIADKTPSPNALVNGQPPASTSYTANTVGTFYWQAVYDPGTDPNYTGSTSTCTDEPLVVLDAGISLSPLNVTNLVNQAHTFTASVFTNNGV